MKNLFDLLKIINLVEDYNISISRISIYEIYNDKVELKLTIS